VKAGFRLAAIALLMLASSASADAQMSRSLTSGLTSEQGRPDSGSIVRHALDRIPASAAPIASLIIPGLGQARLGRDRFMAYLAAEAFLLIQYQKNEAERRTNEASLRSIARDVARRNFPGNHPDSVWQYYEKMEQYLNSGAFSLASSGATIPEIDAGTYNGQQWILARLRYGLPLDDPNPTGSADYGAALAYYESRAIPLAYGWSWDNAQLEKDLFFQAIARRNDASKHATNALIGLIANHLISAVDAFASIRVMQTAGGGLGISTSIPIR
jgi:hypothetical protein